jgi:hypothetical protein
LRKALKQALETSAWPEADLKKSECFSLCPKGGQVLATMAKGQPRRMLVLQPDSEFAPALDYLLRGHG